jgi:hypothetical protein
MNYEFFFGLHGRFADHTYIPVNDLQLVTTATADASLVRQKPVSLMQQHLIPAL